MNICLEISSEFKIFILAGNKTNIAVKTLPQLNITAAS